MFIQLGSTDSAISWITDSFNDYKDDMEPKEREEFEKGIKFLEEHSKGFEVSSLEEYFEILEMISLITDGNYSIWNCGKLIDLEY